MFQLFHEDVAKVDWDVAYVAMVVHVCCKCLSSMFHLFFIRMLQVFQTHVSSVSSVFFCMFQVLHLDISKIDREAHMLQWFFNYMF
jgi:hypothetical protein